MFDNLSIEFIGVSHKTPMKKEAFLKRPTFQDDADNVTYIEDVNLKFIQGDKALVIDGGLHASTKRTFFRIAAGQIEPSEGNVVVNGEVFPAVTTMFGILPYATLYQNAVMRALLFKYSKSEIDIYLAHVFSDQDIKLRKSVKFSEVSDELKVLFQITLLEPFKPSILLIERWTNSQSELISEKCKSLFKRYINESDIAIVNISDSSFDTTLCNRSIVVKQKTVELL